MLEAENWAIALGLYKGHPISAFLLAHQLPATVRLVVAPLLVLRVIDDVAVAELWQEK